MPEQWTPTTEQVRAGYAIDPEAEYRDPITNHTAHNERAFDRWLAAHDAEVLAPVRFALDVHDRYVDASQGRSPDDFATRTATTLREVRKAVK